MQCAEYISAARRQWAEERAKMRASMGEDEPDDPADVLAEEGRDDELQDALDAIAAAFRVKRARPTSRGGKHKASAGATRGGEEKKGDDSADEGEGEDKTAKAKKVHRQGRYFVPPPVPGAPPKKLSCVLFADNTHVLLTGDATGRVDVFRLTGLPGAPDGSPAPPAGSEEHEEQLEAVRAILTTL